MELPLTSIQGLIRKELGKMLHSGRLIASATSIRLVWNWVKVVNTLAYNNTESITAVISFKTKALGH